LTSKEPIELRYLWDGYETVETLSLIFDKTKRRIQQVIEKLKEYKLIDQAYIVKKSLLDGEVVLLGKPCYKRLEK